MIVEQFDNRGQEQVEEVTHCVHVLDCSGSMHGRLDWKRIQSATKYDKAYTAIMSEADKLKKELSKYDNQHWTYSLLEFESSNFKWVLKQENLATVQVPEPTRLSGRLTPLIQAMGIAITSLIEWKNPKDAGLIKVFTDGEENGSRGIWAINNGGWTRLKKLIAACEHHNITVVFSGTKEDVDSIQKRLDLSKGNLDVHQNTVESIQKSGIRGTSATMNYMSMRSKGVKLTKSFYNEQTNQDLRNAKGT